MALLSRFDLNLLVVFEAVFAERGVSRAARRLNLSQPAVSHALSRLRDALGDQLFVRHGNVLTPTARAHALIQPVREALRTIDVAVAQGPTFDPTTSSRRFTVGLRPSGEAPAFASFVVQVLAEAPGVCVFSRYLARRTISQALAEGDLDMALDIEGAASASVLAIPLQAEGLIVAARAGHPQIQGDISLEDYLSLEHIFVSPRPSGTGLEDAVLDKLGRVRKIKVRCQNLLTAMQIVASSDMIMTLPPSQVEMFSGRFGVQIVPLPLTVRGHAMHLYYHRSTEDDPAAAWLRSLAQRHLSTPLTWALPHGRIE